ncbi:4-alpha-glucanotransferase, partial [Streptomyces alfalfae]
MTEAILGLARAHGVATEYTTDRGRRVAVPADTLVAVLGACGVDATTPAAAREALDRHRAEQAARLLPPCVVTRAGEGVTLPRSSVG